jgi:hypothetical protein
MRLKIRKTLLKMQRILQAALRTDLIFHDLFIFSVLMLLVISGYFFSFGLYYWAMPWIISGFSWMVFCTLLFE